MAKQRVANRRSNEGKAPKKSDRASHLKLVKSGNKGSVDRGDKPKAKGATMQNQSKKSGGRRQMPASAGVRGVS